MSVSTTQIIAAVFFTLVFAAEDLTENAASFRISKKATIIGIIIRKSPCLGNCEKRKLKIVIKTRFPFITDMLYQLVMNLVHLKKLSKNASRSEIYVLESQKKIPTPTHSEVSSTPRLSEETQESKYLINNYFD